MAMVPVLVPGITNAVYAACGADFSMVLTKSKVLYSFGWSEFGQLGHGTDGCFNKSASSIKLTFEADRKPSIVTGLRNVVQIACGPHHCVALQEDGVAFTWGCGGYGRLGHLDQADQWTPKELPNFKFRYVCCGNQWTFGVGWRLYSADQKPNGNGIMHIWGQMNSSKDSAMYPKPEYDLQVIFQFFNIFAHFF
jgi:alpha-tubulin suppressor-like RCC1 family protein